MGEPAAPDPVSLAAGALERDAERRVIDDLTTAALSGHGNLLTIRGAPGIGKTRLIDYVAAVAREKGIAVFRARGAELEQQFAFGGVRQLLEDAVAVAPAEVMQGPAALAAHLFSAESPSAATSPTYDDAHFAVLHGLYSLTVQLQRLDPVVFCVDDGHWLDPSSLRYLSYLAQRLERVRVLLAFATRDIDEEGRAVGGVVGAPGREVTLRPSPLSPTATSKLVRARIPGARDNVCQAVHQTTGGNPFFLHEVLSSIERSTDPLTASEVASMAPEGVQGAVARRVARLSETTRRIAVAVAVLDTDVLLRHAAAIADLEIGDAAEAVDQLVACDVLADRRPLQFTHPIVRAAMLRGSRSGALAATHRRSARLLAAEGAPVERVAAHLLATDPEGDLWVVETLLVAAARAKDRGAPEVAVTLLRRAMIEPPQPAARPRLLLELGMAEASALEIPLAIAHLEGAMETSDDPNLRAEAGTHAGFLIGFASSGLDGVRFLMRALERSQGARAELLDELYGHIGIEGRTDLVARPIARHLVDHLLAEVESGAYRSPTALGIYAIDLGMRGAVPAEEIKIAGRRAIGARARSRPTAGDFSLTYGSCALLFVDEINEAADTLGREIHALTVRGAHSITFVPRMFLVEALRRAGRLTEALECATAAAADENAPPAVRPGFRAVLGAVLVDMDRAEEAVELLDAKELPAEHTPLAAAYTNTMAIHARATAHLQLGDAASASRDFLLAGSRLLAIDEITSNAHAWRSGAALALQAQGRGDAARKLALEELAVARRCGAPRAVSVALRAAARIEPDRAAALGGFRQGLDVLGESDALLARAEAHLDLGLALLDANRDAEGLKHLDEARHIARGCGAQAVARRANAAGDLRRGPRSRGRPERGPSALTPAERRVAAFAAQGMSNRDIAERLFVTIRTVEFHLTRAYRRLGIESRTQLAAALLTDSPASSSRDGDVPGAPQP